jgi:hypothetical protein
MNFSSLRKRLERKIARDRSLERPLESVSKSLWPWSEAKLIRYVILIAALDYVSTYAFLKLSSNPDLVEGGPIAGWALRTGGFGKLFLVDAAIVLSMIILAVGLRSLYTTWGFGGLGRAAFVILLIPYFVITLAVVFNNVLLAFL